MSTNTLVVTTPYKLSAKELDSIVGQLKIEGEGLVTQNEVDKSLLGGMIIKYNGYYLDMSLKGKLEDIVNTLT